MFAVTYEKNGGPDVLQYREVPDPVVGEGQVLVRTEYVSIEGGDLLNRKLVPPPTNPFIPGYQVSGTVVEVGAGVSAIKPGQKVAAFNWNGSYAELFCTDHRHVFPVPEGLDMAVASTVPVAFGTADDALFEFGQLKAGETVLIQGAAGGVGLAAVQLAKAAGARVIGTSSSDERLARLADYGLDEGINYRTQNIGKRCLELTDGAGVDFVVDLAGGAGVAQLIEAVRYRGRFAVVGAATGDLPSFQFMDLVSKSLNAFGTLFGAEMHTDRAHALIDTLFTRLLNGELAMPIDKVFPLAEVQAAHTFVEQGHPFGRVLMQP